MLYKFTLDPQPTQLNHYEIEPGNMYSFSVSLEQTSCVDIVAFHVARVQDHSIRMWVSREPGGESVMHQSPATSFWHPNRTPTEIIRIQDDYIGAKSTNTILLPVGNYFVNALNLINSMNIFGLTLTTIPLGDITVP